MNHKDVQIIAFHLPQFHTIPENEKWWGNGFTEWTNTKKGSPLFNGHHQPRVPLNENYYNLLNVDDLTWEMKLANEHGLDGFCYYHYWFNGKLLLEKPLEIMRGIPERLPYCFCWANEPWIRSWQDSSEVLIDQTYSGVSDWEAHFEYLSIFFKDEKYICVNNKPVLVLYRTQSIDNCEDMISYWDKCCKNIGFDGIYIIEEKNGFQDHTVCSNSNAYLEFEPLYSMRFGRKIWEKALDYFIYKAFCFAKGTNNRIYSYDRIWNNILIRSHEVISGKAICLGGFVDWDNTARKGFKSTFFYGSNPQKFKKYMQKQVSNARALNSPFVFINAWNEWGEGAYLEPDNKNGYDYLNALSALKDLKSNM